MDERNGKSVAVVSESSADTSQTDLRQLREDGVACVMQPELVVGTPPPYSCFRQLLPIYFIWNGKAK